MASDYLPVMLSIDQPHPDLQQWIAERFERLNGKRVHIVERDDLPDVAKEVYGPYRQAWIWDVVPKFTRRVLFVDTDMVPLRPLPEIPDAPFVAARDAEMQIEYMAGLYPSLPCFFNVGFFVARRDTQPLFDQLKSFAVWNGQDDYTNGEFLQTHFNHIMQSTVGVEWMSHDLNTVMLCADPEMMKTAIAVHFCALPMDTNLVMMNLLRHTIGLDPLPEEEDRD